jgi:hypothetical protein
MVVFLHHVKPLGVGYMGIRPVLGSTSQGIHSGPLDSTLHVTTLSLGLSYHFYEVVYTHLSGPLFH